MARKLKKNIRAFCSLCFFAFLTSLLRVGKSQFGDKKFFTENFLYYIDFFGWEMMIKEGKKAPGQYLNFVLKVCCYNGFDAKSVKLYSLGGWGSAASRFHTIRLVITG